MRSTAFLGVGFALLILQSNLHRLVGLAGVAGLTPNLLLPLVVFMGVHEFSVTRGVLLACALGFMLDDVAAAPAGLYWFLSVATFLLARAAGVRLAAQTLLTQFALAFAFALFEGVAILTLTAIFGDDPARPRALAALVGPHAVATALIAPPVFRLAERIHQGTLAVARGGEVSR